MLQNQVVVNFLAKGERQTTGGNVSQNSVTSIVQYQGSNKVLILDSYSPYEY